MKVWIVYFSDYDVWENVKVVDSEEKADAEVKRLNLDCPNCHDYEEYEVE